MVITRQVVANGKFSANVAIPTLAMVNQTYPAKFADLLALGLWEEYVGLSSVQKNTQRTAVDPSVGAVPGETSSSFCAQGE